MRVVVLTLLIGLPLVEIAAFIVVGDRIGVLATIGLTLATSIAGAVLLSVQGAGILRRIQASLRAEIMPGRELVHGALVTVGAFLLILPGFVTDLAGLLLFVPPVRDAVWTLTRRHVVVEGFDDGQPGARRAHARTIDLDAEDYTQHDVEAERLPRRDG